MTHIEQAIRDAVEKGEYEIQLLLGKGAARFEGDYVVVKKPADMDGWISTFKEKISSLDTNKLFHDPTFWQALGKARGWDGKTLVRRGAIIGNFVTPDHKSYAEMGFGMDYISTWCFYWHCFIDHLAEGKDAESFFANL